MRVPVEPTHCCHGRLHAQHIVVMVVAAARAARLRIACGVVFMSAADPVGSRGRIGEKPSSPATSPAVAAAPCFGRVPLPSRPRRGRCTSSTGERGGGVSAKRCPLPTRRPPVCGGVVGSEQRRPPPQLLPLPPASRCQSTQKKKKEPPRHTTRLHGHTRPPTLATQQKEQATTIPHPRPTRATPPPSTPALTRAAPRRDTTQPSPRPRGSARAPPRWPQGSPTTAGHTAFLTNRDRVNSPQAGSWSPPHGSAVRPTATQPSDPTTLRRPARCSPVSARPPIPVTAHPQPRVHRAFKAGTP